MFIFLNSLLYLKLRNQLSNIIEHRDPLFWECGDISHPMISLSLVGWSTPSSALCSDNELKSGSLIANPGGASKRHIWKLAKKAYNNKVAPQEAYGVIRSLTT